MTLENRPQKIAATLLLAALGCALFVFLGIRATPQAAAQAPTPTPTPNCTATPTISPTPTCTPVPTVCKPCSDGSLDPADPEAAQSPAATPIPSEFQPPDGTILKWRRYVPLTGGPRWPVVLVIHIGGFKTGSPYDGGPEQVAADLQAKGYLALSVTYRLAPCGLILGQHCHDQTPDGIASGRPPEQTDDIKTLVRAARVDEQGNGKVGVVGGSAGGSHAAFVALDIRTINDWTHWSASQRPDVVACLSGAYDFSDRDLDVTHQFINNVENYTNTCVRVDPDPNKPDQKKVSPVARVTTPTSSVPFRPMFLINSDGDSMPPHQIVDMQCALVNAGVDPNLYQVLTLVHNDKHAFAYWGDFDGQGPPQRRVKADVIDFLDSYLKGP